MRVWREIRIFAVVGIFLVATTFQTQAFAAFSTLPNPIVTPGAISPLVNQQNIGTTICRSGFTSTIRPSSSYTTALKRSQLKSYPYSNYGSTDVSLFEEDHLIPLELGGNPTSVKNLWPEPWSGNFDAHDKDQLENKLKSLVCARSLALEVAQKAIATNWQDAYQKYVLGTTVATPSFSITPTPSTQSLEGTPNASPTSLALPPTSEVSPSQLPIVIPSQNSTPTPTSSKPVGATGKCNDGTYSFAASHRGMCSGHGGVAQFYI